jgi:copper chaperone CopZ
MQRLRLGITGMTCDGCAATVRRVLLTQPGVDAARVDRAAACAEVEGAADPAALAAAVRAVGFGAHVERPLG